FLRNCFVFC
ncbi:hypothetical protein CP02DC21_2093, partial [Chlamydia psittaci 02DC21]